MEEIKNWINSITQDQINSIITAIIIAISFSILSAILAHIIIKIFKIDKKHKTGESAFYRPLKGFFSVLGIYTAIMYLKEPLQISENIINTVKTIYRISLILVISNGFVKGLDSQTGIIKKLQLKINPKKAENKNSIEFLIKIIKVIIYTIAVVLIIQELGFDLKGLIAGLGIGGVIITLAAQDTAKNLFGGIVIFLDKPFNVGDYIQFGTYNGTVEDITFRSTAIRALDGSLLHIPNSEISSVVITNWNELNKRRYKVSIVVTLETPLQKIEKVKNQIKEMLEQDEEIIQDSIMVNFENILDNGNEIVVIASTNTTKYAEYLKLKERLNYNILNILEKSKVDLAYNTQTIHIKN